MKSIKIFSAVLIICFLQLIDQIGCGSDDLIESWQKIKTNHENDIQQSLKIYKKIKEEQRALAELRVIVERHLRTKNAEQLVNLMSSNNISTIGNHFEALNKDFSENYDKPLVEGIFAEAINELALTSELPKMPATLWNIYQKNDTQSFDIMLRAQMQLYNSFGQKQHTDAKEFLQHFANRLHKIKQEHLFNTLDLSLKLQVQNIIDQLPDNVKYLYFMPYFCLLNIKYSTYIYTAIDVKVDPLSRYIWLWRDSRTMDDTGFIKAEIADLDENSKNQLSVSLKGTKYQMFYYMMANTMRVAGWDSAGTPSNYIWNIDFLDNDRVVLSQNDHLMCAVDKHDNDRRNVGGRKKGEVSPMSAECQWRLGRCVFT